MGTDCKSALSGIEKHIYGKLVFSVYHEEYRTETEANRNAFDMYEGDFETIPRISTHFRSNPLNGPVYEYNVYERMVLHFVFFHSKK